GAENRSRWGGGACWKGRKYPVTGGRKTSPPSSKLSYFGLVVEGKHDGRYTGNAVLLGFDAGKVHASLSSTKSPAVVLRGGLRAGTFSGRDLLGRPVRGSFRC